VQRFRAPGQFIQITFENFGKLRRAYDQGRIAASLFFVYIRPHQIDLNPA